MCAATALAVGASPDLLADGGAVRLYDRTALYEILEIDEPIRDQVIERTSASVVKQTAVERGTRTLRMDGLQKVIEGRTTVEEVFRVLRPGGRLSITDIGSAKHLEQSIVNDPKL